MRKVTVILARNTALSAVSEFPDMENQMRDSSAIRSLAGGF
jgi:hypothetical protein